MEVATFCKEGYQHLGRVCHSSILSHLPPEFQHGSQYRLPKRLCLLVWHGQDQKISMPTPQPRVLALDRNEETTAAAITIIQVHYSVIQCSLGRHLRWKRVSRQKCLNVPRMNRDRSVGGFEVSFGKPTCFWTESRNRRREVCSVD